MSKEIRTRSEVPKQDTWSVEDIYPDNEMFLEELKKLGEMAKPLAAMEGTLSDGSGMLSYYRYLDEMNLLADRVMNYAMLKRDEDTKNPVYQDYYAQTVNTVVALNRAGAFAEPEILSVSEEKIHEMIEQTDGLKMYERAIGEVRRLKDHILDRQTEQLLAMAQEMANTPHDIFSMFNEADLTFPPAVDENGKEHPVTHGTFIPLLQSSDRTLRKNVFYSLYDTLKGFENTAAAMIFGQVKQLSFFATARKYDSSIEAALAQNNVPLSVYENLIEAVHEKMPVMHRYVALRKKMLGLDELHMYDLYTPIVSDTPLVVMFEQAKEEVKETVRVFGEEYASVIDRAFEERWIDIYENKGKRSGAYSSGCRVHPYILLNYSDTLDSEFTLIHELGHSMHSYLSNQNQPIVDADYVIFVAEVASTCNEALLMQHLLKKTDDPGKRAYLINYFLEQFRSTVYRQTMFAEFEREIGKMAKDGVSLTADVLKKLYHDLNVCYYGTDVIVDEAIDMEWARIPHFYYNYYVYQYATGFAAAIALSKRILEGGEEAVRDYLEFLSGGCSMAPIDLLKHAGVDMTGKEPVLEALELFDSLITQLEELMMPEAKK